MSRYTEAERGRFDAWLLCDNTAVAFTDHDVVKPTPDYIHQRDYEAVCKFADDYELPLDISI